MKNSDFKIEPEYKFKTYFKYFFFLAGIVLVIIPLIIDNYDVLSFLGLVSIIIGLIFTVFASKQYLRINRDQIEFESKSIIKEFSKLLTIKFADINEVHFLKRQFLIFGGRNPVADADAQTLYNENRIVFLLKNKKSETIMQTGKLEEFRKAYDIIKSKVDKKATGNN